MDILLYSLKQHWRISTFNCIYSWKFTIILILSIVQIIIIRSIFNNNYFQIKDLKLHSTNQTSHLRMHIWNMNLIVKIVNFIYMYQPKKWLQQLSHFTSGFVPHCCASVNLWHHVVSSVDFLVIVNGRHVVLHVEQREIPVVHATTKHHGQICEHTTPHRDYKQPINQVNKIII